MTISTGASAMISKSSYTGTAVSSAGSDTPPKAYDNNTSTRWASGHHQVVGDWYRVDLGATYKVHKTRLYCPTWSGDFPNSYKIEVSTNGSTWTQVWSGAGAVDHTATFTATWARYVKFTLTASDPDSWWSIYELEIWHYPTALNQTVTKTITSTNLSSVKTLQIWVRSDRTGTNFQFGWGESAYSDHLHNITIGVANTWEKKSLDISGVASGSKDAVTKIGFKVTNVDTNFNFWADNLYCEIVGGAFLLNFV